MKTKELYSFPLTDDQGETYRFFFKQPNREEQDEITIFRASLEWRLINEKKMPSVAMIDKIYGDKMGSAMTLVEEREFLELQKEYNDLRISITKVAREDRNQDEIEKETNEMFLRINQVSDRMRVLQLKKESVYNNTAEKMARDKTIEYCFLFFSFYQKDNQEAKPLIEGKEYEDRVAAYDEKEWTGIWERARMRLLLVATFAYYGTANSQKEFEDLLDSAELE